MASMDAGGKVALALTLTLTLTLTMDAGGKVVLA